MLAMSRQPPAPGETDRKQFVESDRHAISGRALERIELEPPINERVRLNGPLVAERVHRTSLYGLAGQSLGARARVSVPLAR